jgi:hypothetical protein
MTSVDDQSRWSTVAFSKRVHDALTFHRMKPVGNGRESDFRPVKRTFLG